MAAIKDNNWIQYALTTLTGVFVALGAYLSGRNKDKRDNFSTTVESMQRQMNEQEKHYNAIIKTLQDQMKDLKTEVRSIRQDNDNIRADNISLKTLNAQLTNDNEELREKNEDLTIKVSTYKERLKEGKQ